ncbi:ruBisCO large subunit-binding protein subunit alpha, chloroplastic-like [Gossypium australe]|uniref:RuBisCO large subunit-binding protein subunit alpha, chloroplastic-like n=1 Tax=Gossypium australe TaxID=47621 RepID=A0A5B6WJ72_9ROSI|nr:ruBisCO large subunit-binding protein subunit alpha, chloroplastic-like [Gossypium australe]
MASVGNAKLNKPECGRCGKRHFGECRMDEKACFRCGSYEHFIRDCPELDEKDKSQNVRSSNMTVKGRPPRSVGNVSGSRSATRDTAVRSEARAPGRTSAIRAREEASSPNNNEIIQIESEESSELPIVISSMSTQRYVRKGWDAYLAYVLDTKVSESKIELVLVVCEYPDMFPKELPGLPPIRKVEFAIDLVPRTSPISIAPYRMALKS